MDINTVEGLTAEQKIGAELFSKKLNEVITAAYVSAPSYKKDRTKLALELFITLAHREPLPAEFEDAEVDTLFSIRREYKLEDQLEYAHLADFFGSLLL